MARKKLLRLIGSLLLIASLALLAVALVELTSRLRERSDVDPPARWAVQRIYDESVTMSGDPVHFRTVTDDAGKAEVEVSWRQHSARLPIGGRDNPKLPELLRHDDWMRALWMVRVNPGQTPESALASESSDERLVVVGRAPPEGFKDERWGRVHRDAWRYTFILMKPDGSFEQSMQTYAELTQRTWRHAAALWVTPGPQRPDAELVDDGFARLGWSWGASQVGALGVVGGVLLIAATFLPGRKAVASGGIS